MAEHAQTIDSVATATAEKSELVKGLGLFDATMLVMGGIVGSGIFINPYVVAQQVHTPVLILGASTLLIGPFMVHFLLTGRDAQSEVSAPPTSEPPVAEPPL